MRTDEMMTILKHSLSQKRFLHSIGVADTACCLAMRYDEDVEKAQIAGLLHDCAKCIKDSKKIRLCHKYGIEISQLEKENPYLLHAKLGAFLAFKIYGVDTEEITSAILYHITGHPDMTKLEKIIFIADYIEPYRKKIPGLNEIRTMAFQDLDMSIVMATENILKYLREKNQAIDSMTEKTWNYYCRMAQIQKGEQERCQKS